MRERGGSVEQNSRSLFLVCFESRRLGRDYWASKNVVLFSLLWIMTPVMKKWTQVRLFIIVGQDTSIFKSEGVFLFFITSCSFQIVSGSVLSFSDWHGFPLPVHAPRCVSKASHAANSDSESVRAWQEVTENKRIILMMKFHRWQRPTCLGRVEYLSTRAAVFSENSSFPKTFETNPRWSACSAVIGSLKRSIPFAWNASITNNWKSEKLLK